MSIITAKYRQNREDAGKQLLLDHPEICKYLFGSNMRGWIPAGTGWQYDGVDFVTVSGLKIDLKSCLGYAHPYYQLSTKRRYSESGSWEDVLLDKETQVWLHLIQTDDNTIGLFTLHRDNVEPLLEYCKLENIIRYKGAKYAGGNDQYLMEIPISLIYDNSMKYHNYIKTYDKHWDIKQNALVPNRNY